MLVRDKVLNFKGLATTALLTGLLLTACSSSPEEAQTGEGTAIKDIGAVSGVSVKGDFGAEPTMTFVGEPSDNLDRTVLVEGDGETVEDGDLVFVDFTGQVFGGEVFDTSFGGESLPFLKGGEEVIQGWEKTLEGQKAGSRVVISVPAADGYGDTGYTDIGVQPDSTMVFVIDILGSYDTETNLQKDAIVENEPFPGVTVTGEIGEAVGLSVDPASTLPTEDKVIVLARGSGPAVTEGTVAAQFAASSWDGLSVSTSRDQGGLSPLPVGVTDSIIDQLVGVPVGSRVLLVYAPLAEDTAPASTSVAVAIDIIAQP